MGGGTGGGKTKLDSDVCGVVVIDVQNDYCAPGGLAAQEGADVGRYAPVMANLDRLVTAARGTGVPVIWVQNVRDSWAISTVWNARHGMVLDPPPGETRPPKCMRGTWGAEFFHVQPEPGEPVIAKRRYNAFAGTDLEIVLRTLGLRSLLFTGIVTNICVESSLREALFRDFHVVLVEDCCGAPDDAAHEATVRTVREAFGPVVTVADVAKHWDEERTTV